MTVSSGSYARKMSQNVQRFQQSAASLGVWNALRNKVSFVYHYGVVARLRAPLRGRTHTLRSRESRYPLECRFYASDSDVFQLIFVRREYACLTDLNNVRFIVDCGANVGYSAAYLLTQFPQARLAAVEPDDANYEVLARNMKPYGERARLYKNGVWSHTTGLIVCHGGYRDGREHSIQVRECEPGEEPNVCAIDIPTILRESGCSMIDILKVDIEGAEAVVFGPDSHAWLPHVRSIVIEIHDSASEAAVHAAIAPYDYVLSYSEEVLVCRQKETAKSIEIQGQA